MTKVILLSPYTYIKVKQQPILVIIDVHNTVWFEFFKNRES